MDGQATRENRSFRRELVPNPVLKPFTLPKLPIDVEIGCGVGWHPIQYARRNPNRHIIAIEKSVRRFGLFRSRLEHHPKIPNLTPIHSNAVSWIAHNLTPASVSRYFLLYPNPREKWERMPFLTWVIQTLKPHGTLEIRSNEKPFIERMKKTLCEQMEVLREETVPAGSSPLTHFEKKYLEQGQKCFRLVFKKSQAYLTENKK